MRSADRGRNEHGHATGPGHRSHPSSFSIHDPEIVDRELGLREGDCFLDLGCGAGDYALRAAPWVGATGSVLAFDRDSAAIQDLVAKTRRLGVGNVHAQIADLTAPLPLADRQIDVRLIATALHMLKLDRIAEHLFPELRRVLKDTGRLVVIECKKEETPCGPPLWMRISADEIETAAAPYGFRMASLVDLGNNYLARLAPGPC